LKKNATKASVHFLVDILNNFEGSYEEDFARGFYAWLELLCAEKHAFTDKEMFILKAPV
jgi:hypothetical protein